MSKDDNYKRDLIRGLSNITQISVTIIICIAIGLFAGRFLDNWLNTSPWFLLGGIMLGMCAAFKSIIDFCKYAKF